MGEVDKEFKASKSEGERRSGKGTGEELEAGSEGRIHGGGISYSPEQSKYTHLLLTGSSLKRLS